MKGNELIPTNTRGEWYEANSGYQLALALNAYGIKFDPAPLLNSAGTLFLTPELHALATKFDLLPGW